MELLTEVGYERLTTAQIARRAGVSKGAQAHHYPTKDDLLVAAFRHLLMQWEQRLAAFAATHDDRTSMEVLLQSLWRDVFGRPDYLASVEAMLAARHHPALRDRLRDVLATWTAARDDTFRRLLPIKDPEELATFLQFNFNLLRGLAVYAGLADDTAPPQRMLAMWAEMANAFVASRRKSVPKPARKSAARPASKPTSKPAPKPASPASRSTPKRTS